MEKVVRRILIKYGFSKIKKDDRIGWDFTALKNNQKKLIELKETTKSEYFRRNSFSCTKAQKDFYNKGKLIILFIYHPIDIGINNFIIYKIIFKNKVIESGFAKHI
jgi:hypothetical protein